MPARFKDLKSVSPLRFYIRNYNRNFVRNYDKKRPSRAFVLFSFQNLVISNDVLDALKYSELSQLRCLVFFSLLCKLEWTDGNGGRG